MKRNARTLLCLLLPPLLVSLSAQEAFPGSEQERPPASTTVSNEIVGIALDPVAAKELQAEVGPDHRTIFSLQPAPSPERPTEAVAGWVTELANGLNRWDPDAQTWRAARAEFETTGGGYVVARQTRHQAILAPDLRVEGAVDLMTPEGLRLRSTILGLGVRDRASERSVLLAELKSSTAELVSANEVIYRDAFDDVHADVRYSLKRDEFEQDLVLREEIAPEWLEELGINPATAELFVMTEFFEAPTPEVKAQVLVTSRGMERADQELEFGSMRIGVGRAFSQGEPRGEGDVIVQKSWSRLEGRQFLIEAVDYLELAPLLERLPAAEGARVRTWEGKVGRSAALPRRVEAVREVRADAPQMRDGRVEVVGPTRPAGERRYAMTEREKGVVVDYILILGGSSTSFTLEADKTYSVTGTFTVNGPLTIEGGTVVKYASTNSASIVVNTVNCQTGRYLPAVFTSRDDHTVGEKLTTAVSIGTYPGPALTIRSSGQKLSDVRVRYADCGVFFQYTSAATRHTVSHCQFVRCGQAIRADAYGSSPQLLALRNVLIDNATTGIYGYNVQASIEHLTANQCGQLLSNYNGGYSSSLFLTNSLLLGTPSGNGSVSSNATSSYASGTPGVFQSVGGGNFYLPGGSPNRDAGVTLIDATLAGELKELTTQAPVVYASGTTPTGDLTLFPQAQRDTDVPDRGYHYAPLDYAVAFLTLNNGVTATVKPGTAIGVYGNRGVVVENHGHLVVEGTPAQMVRFTPYTTVQEQAYNWSVDPSYSQSLVVGPPHDTTGQSVTATIRCRFATFSGLAYCGAGINTDCAWFAPLAIDVKDCQFFNSAAFFGGHFSRPTVIDAKNNLFIRGWRRFYGWGTFNVHNNLFWSGTNTFYNLSVGWQVRDNAFHDTPLSSLSGITNSHNAYLGVGQVQLTGASPPNVVASSFNYVKGPWGSSYHASAGLRDQGSRTAAAAGLYHHTTTGGKEAASQVDIGFHYPAGEIGSAGLVAHWALDEGSGTSASDSSGKGHTMNLINGPTWVSGTVGSGALQCDGSNDYGTTPDASDLRLPNDLALSFWMYKTVEQPTVSTRMVGKGTSSGANGNYAVFTYANTGGKLLFQQNTPGGSWMNLVSGSATAVNTWYHVAAVKSGAVHSLYLNGTLDASGAFGSAAAVSADPVNLAYIVGQTPFAGRLDDVRIFNRAVSSVEVEALATQARFDTDGDGLPDVIEDVNGNSAVDSGETSWQSASDTGLKIRISRPGANQPIP